MPKLKVSEFVKITGSTLKTINYYHKIGLLPEPERSSGGYRLYGPPELDRMRLIKRLKSLGLDLKQIKQIMGNLKNQKNSREILQTLRLELADEKQRIEERMAKIDVLLRDENLRLEKESLDSPSFDLITDILGTEEIDQYARTCPEIYDQHRKIYGILDDLKWGEDYSESFRALAEYFKSQPEKYQVALQLGALWGELSHLSEDDPRIETYAWEAASQVKNMPPIKEMILNHPGMKTPFADMYQEMVADVLSPAQIKYRQLFERFLSED